jgi:exopolysaccharide biosynthesis polyprenyl glycosylphosphotransferase
MLTQTAPEIFVDNLYPPVKPKRPPAEFSRSWARVLLGIDVVAFLASEYASAAVAQHALRLDLRLDTLTLLWSFALVLFWLMLYARVGLYRRSFALTVKDEFYYTLAALSLGAAPVLLCTEIFPQVRPARLGVFLTLLFALAIDGSARAVAHLVRTGVSHRRPLRIALVGEVERINTAADALDFTNGTAVLRIPVQDIDASINGIDLTLDQDLDSIEWLREARDWGCDTLLLTEMLPPFVMPHLLEVAARSHFKVAFAPPRVKTHAYSLSFARSGNQTLIVPSRLRACTPSAQLLKRCFDIAVAAPALVVFMPALALVALAILLDGGGPVLYRQVRVGQGGHLFEILKFRSMPVDAEAKTGPVWTVQGAGHSKRTTRVGGFLRRSSLDELPQLFNVLRGDMSIVGPRPERPAFVEQFRKSLPRYDERHLVRPGITGWSHVHMKRNHDQSQMGERLAYDLFYVEHWSMFMDLTIIFKTAAEVFFHKAS